MKKLLLFTFSLVAFGGFGQVIFDVQAPGSIAGTYQATFSNDDGAGWGGDLSTTTVTGDLVLADDGTAADSLACDPLTNGGAMAGNIALLYRGDCEFGTKSLNAENAGAIAVVIVNNIPGAPVAMGGGVDGPNVTIPVAMISATDGQTIRDEMANGTVTVFMGSKFGINNDDIGMGLGDINNARSFSMPNFIANDDNNFTITPGAWITNFGNNDQTDVVLTAEIDFGGTTIYSQSSTPATILSGDTLYVDLTDFAQTNYDQGYYTLTYTISMGATDEDPGDNEIVTNFWVNDEIYSKNRFDSNGDPISNAGYTTGDFQNSFEACIVLSEQAADSLPLYKVGFGASTAEENSLTGQLIDVVVYEWNDAFATANDATFNSLTTLSSDSYIYASDLQDEFVEVFVNGGQGLVLNNNQKYMVCVKTYTADIFINYDNGINYLSTSTVNDEWYYPVNSGGWFAAGFGLENVPAIYLGMKFDESVSTEEMEQDETASAYPNPAVNFINIPLKEAAKGNAQVNVMDMTGKKVLSQDVNIESNELRFDVSNVETGRYIINVTYADGSVKNHNVIINK